MMELTKARTSDALVLNGISKRAFDSDVAVGAPSKAGPPGYQSVNFHIKMARGNHLYKLSENGLIVGGAILFVDGSKLNIGRIFVDPEYFRKGYGIFMMQEIERIFPDAKEIFLDTPIWNIRTNAFYQKLDYIEYKRNDEFIYYTKRRIEMENKQNYIQWIRSKVGHEKIILIFAGGCIFNEKGEILLQKRGSGKWGFPGGAIELGETPQMAAIREAKEETGLDVEVGSLIGIYTDCNMEYPNGDKAHSILIAYELDAVGGELFCDQEETLELKYFSLDDTPELFCKQHEELLNDIIARKTNIPFRNRVPEN